MTAKMTVKTQPAPLTPGLYIVAMPIGNLRDITLRALDVLAGADVILAEDTRQSAKLLAAYDIKASLKSLHDHNEAGRIPEIIALLEAGKTVAQVSDAGTPLISDPGFKLARAVIEAGFDVIPIPGACAPIAGLMAAGLPTDKFLFAGFLPPKTTGRRKALEKLSTTPGSLVFFESGPRLTDSLTDMQAVLGDRPAVIARELTKTYEEFRRGPISDLIEGAKADPPRGEIVVIVAPLGKSERWTEGEIDAALTKHLPEMGAKRASAHIADLSGWAKRDVYQRAISKK